MFKMRVLHNALRYYVRLVTCYRGAFVIHLRDVHKTKRLRQGRRQEKCARLQRGRCSGGANREEDLDKSRKREYYAWQMCNGRATSGFYTHTYTWRAV